mgnify:CR=1 FL=1
MKKDLLEISKLKEGVKLHMYLTYMNSYLKETQNLI